MKSVVTKGIYVLTLFLFFMYGLIAGVYKIFPEPQMRPLKHYIEKQKTTKSVVTYNSFLQRLLIKKIQLPSSLEQSGAISVTDKILFIVSNKGTIMAYDLDMHVRIDNNILDVPMNLDALYRSGHPHDDFRMSWFRVNGLYSQLLNESKLELFASHNGYHESEDCITHNISKIKLSFSETGITQLGGWETIFTAAPCLDPKPENIAAVKPYPGHISSGPMIDYDENRLLVTIGDYNRHGIGGIEEWASNNSNPYGKTILLNKKSGKWSIFTKGNRNITGLFKDENDKIWSVENGPNGGDELNLLTEGNNYGWPEVSYGLWYDHSFELIGKHRPGTHPLFAKPIFSWVPSVAPRGLIKIGGSKFEYWEDDLLMGTMRDNSFHRLRMDENNRVIFDERIKIGHRIRDMVSLPDGKIAVITDDNFLIIIDDGGPVFQEINSDIEQRMIELKKFESVSEDRNVSLTGGAKLSAQVIFQKKCSICHSIEPVNGIGPHLDNLFNRKVGGNKNYIYSNTLKADMRTWNARLLKIFLEKPEQEFRGTSMQKVSLTSAEIDSLVKFLDSK